MDIHSLRESLREHLKQYLETGDTNLVAGFCGATSATVRQWERGSSVPGGERIIKLWILLESLGYPVEELASIPPIQRYVAELFSFKVISMADAQEILGYSEPQKAQKAMRGQYKSLNINWTMEALVELYGSLLAEKRGELQPSVPSDPVLPARSQRDSEPAPTLCDPVSEGATVDASIHFLASLLSGAIPLTEMLVSDSCSDQDRAKLRELVGVEQLQVLKSNIHQLTGKRARDFRQQGKVSRW